MEETHIAEDGNIKFVEEEKENADSNFLDIKSGSRLTSPSVEPQGGASINLGE